MKGCEHEQLPVVTALDESTQRELLRLSVWEQPRLAHTSKRERCLASGALGEEPAELIARGNACRPLRVLRRTRRSTLLLLSLNALLERVLLVRALLAAARAHVGEERRVAGGGQVRSQRSSP